MEPAAAVFFGKTWGAAILNTLGGALGGSQQPTGAGERPNMNITLTKDLKDRLRDQGIISFHPVGTVLPQDTTFEPPCSMKWMTIIHALELGAFSYAVNGYYFACRIGRYCSFGEMVQIGRHAHPLHYFSTSPFFYSLYPAVIDQEPPANHDVNGVTDFQRSTPPTQLKHTTIENDVWIGHGAFILPGLRIGTGAVIAAQAVVTRDVPPYAMVAGSPAAIKRYRFPEATREALLASRWWDFAPWQIKGVVTDDVEAFLGDINERRAKGLEPYVPDLVNLATL